MADGSIIIDTKIDSTGLDKQLTNLKANLQNTTDSLNNLTGKALIGFAALGAAIAPSIKLASDLNESANAAKVVFGETSSTIQDFGRVAQEQAGLTSAEFNQMAAQIGASLINAGQSQEDAAKQSVELTKRAADMASVFNTDVSEALTAIQAGLRGESEPLRRFAVGLDEAQVAAKAVEMGLAKSTSTVDAYGKSQARLAIIMQQSNAFAGDFVNTSDQLANSTRITTAMIKEEAAQAGTKLLPIVLDVIRGFLDWAKEGDRLAKIMQGMADAIKWAIDSGFAQGVLAAVVAVKALTVAMTLLTAAASVTPLAALTIALGAAIGVMVTVTSATASYNKQLLENNRLSAENKKTANEIIGPTEGLAGAQKLSAEQVAKLIKLYPELNGVISAGVTDLKTARMEMEKAAEAQRQLNLALAVKQKTEQLNLTYQSISRIRKEQERLNNDLSGVPKESAAYQNAQKDVQKFSEALAKAEADAGTLRTEIAKINEESLFGAGGFKPTTTPTSTPASTSNKGTNLAAEKERLAQLQKIFEAEQALREQEAANIEAINKKRGAAALQAAQEEAAALEKSGGAKTFAAYKKALEDAFQKVEDGAMSWKDYEAASKQATDAAINGLYAIGVTAQDQTDAGEFLRTLIKSANASASNIEITKVGVNIVKKIADGMKQGWGIALNVTRKTVEMIGRAFQIGLESVKNVFNGFGGIIEGIANFDPKKIFEDFKKIIDGIKDFFETDIGATPIFINAGVKIISDLISGLLSKKDVIFQTIENAISSIAETIQNDGPSIITSVIELISGVIKSIMKALPSLISAGLSLIIALNTGLLEQAPSITATIVSTIGSILQTLANSLPEILTGMTNIALAMTQALTNGAPVIISALFSILTALINNIGDTAGQFAEAGIQLIIAMALAIVENIPMLVDAFINNLPKILAAIIGALPLIVDGVVRVLIELFEQGFNFAQMARLGVAIIEGIAKGIAGAMNNLIESTKQGFARFIQSIKDFFGIASPSKVFAKFGGYMAEGIGVGINKEGKGLFSSVSGTFAEFNRQAANALVLDPTMKISADAVNSVMSGLSNNANMALNLAGEASINASAKQAIQITPAPVIMDGRQVAEVTFRYTDQLVGAAFGA